MVAARMAVPFLQEVELGKRPKLPKSIKRQSLNEMAAFVAGEAGQSEPQNVESRVWRPSLARHSSGGRCLDHRYRPCSRWWNDYYGDQGFRTLTPLILVRIRVPQPVITYLILHMLLSFYEAYFLANLRGLPVSCSKRSLAETVSRALSARKSLRRHFVVDFFRGRSS